ncbi:uncharacterized protein LOC130675992 [Microplitis mediator]|uniref:uncharacterized protein LOC130675992 n=1 Tax=Microplitis mediator TaxID=375433 RepID=UPI002554C2B5|nr:uncharacterized protein LOC130675992 [Microplitis mediator]
MVQLEAALGTSSNEVENNPARPDDPQKLQELKPIRSQGVVANFYTLRNEYQEQEYPINNYPLIRGIMRVEHDHGKRFTNGHAPLANEKNKTIDKAGYDPVKAKLDDPAFRTLNCESKEKKKTFLWYSK